MIGTVSANPFWCNQLHSSRSALACNQLQSVQLSRGRGATICVAHLVPPHGSLMPTVC
jgi:hypothetical protein